MEPEIYMTNNDFDFSKISISQPSAIQGGAYITKIKYDNNPLYIQTPKCLTKQGINDTNKKSYIDLMYTNEDNMVIEWFEHLETKLVNLVYEKRELWFQNDMDLEDIENFFNPITRAFKGGKFHLVRIHIPKNKTINSQYNCTVYDENESIIPIKELNETHTIIPCLEVHGIKFSARNFQIELLGKQFMVLNNKPIFNSCIIKRNSSSSNTNTINNNLIDDSNILYKEHIESIDTSSKVLDENEYSDDNIPKLTQNQNEITDNSNISLGNSENDNSDDNINAIVDNAIQFEMNHETKDVPVDVQVDTPVDAPIDVPVDVHVDANEDIHTSNINMNNEESIQEDTNNDDTLYNINTADSNISNPELNRLTHIYLEDMSQKINIDDNSSSIKLKQPNEVYYEIYKIAKQKARQHKKAAITHYLEAKKIKNTYLLDDLYNSDDSSNDSVNEDSDSDNLQNQINDIIEEII